MYCTTCGKELPDGASVCDECKTSFSGSGQAVPAEEKTEAYQADEPENQTEETENSHRPYMDYKPFSGTYRSESSWQEQSPGNGQTGFAIASLVLGILAICGCCLPVITIPLGILAIIFAVPGMKSINRGIAVAGLILGIIALILSMMMLLIIFLSAVNGSHHSYFW